MSTSPSLIVHVPQLFSTVISSKSPPAPASPQPSSPLASLVSNAAIHLIGSPSPSSSSPSPLVRVLTHPSTQPLSSPPLDDCNDARLKILNSLSSPISNERSFAVLEAFTQRFSMSQLGSTGSNLSLVQCVSNCSGRGDCQDGVCVCQVEFAGGACDDPNSSFFIAFSTIFYIISAVSFIQLALCIQSEFSRQKPRSLLRAFRITTQKALYFFIIVATGLRGYYFSTKDPVTNGPWSESLQSAYYPVLMSGSSLIVCFWAEVFHLHDVSPERPGFLSKSFTGFILFNVVTYSLLFAELVLLQFGQASPSERSFFQSVFNSIYGFLMLVIVVFFLIYGVEVFFKIRGAFMQGQQCPADWSQLHQSRFGLVSQASLLLVTVLFIFSDVCGSLWKDKVPVLSRNTHQIVFRLVEMGVALWFPCVLWNCFRPEALWILNPRKILKKLPKSSHGLELRSLVQGQGPDASPMESNRLLAECWICYDSDKTDAGPLIQPCSCRGDVSAVHHDCLRTWLMESNSNPDHIKCKVCSELYCIQKGSVWLPSGFTISSYFQTAATMTIMCSAGAGLWLMITLFDHSYVRTISVGTTILIEYICLRYLGFNVLSAYNRAKFSAIKIGGIRLVPVPGSDCSSDDAVPSTSSSSSSSSPFSSLKGKSPSRAHQTARIMSVSSSGSSVFSCGQPESGGTSLRAGPSRTPFCKKNVTTFSSVSLGNHLQGSMTEPRDRLDTVCSIATSSSTASLPTMQI